MNAKKINYNSYLLGILIVTAGLFLDQYTKLLAVAHLKDRKPVILIKDVFQLYYLENRGAAFGMLQNQKIFFLLCGVILMAVVAYLYVKLPHTGRFLPLRICMAAIVSGALGNMIDRARLSYVVDFFYFELIDFPVFNVADIYVTLSAVALILLILFYYKDEELECLFHLFSRKNSKGKKTGGTL